MSAERPSRQYGIKTPLNPKAAAFVQYMVADENWRQLTRRPAEQTRQAYRIAFAQLPQGEPVARVEDYSVPVQGGAILARLYARTDARDRVIVWLHGGGFTLGSVADSDSFARHLANQSGAAVVSVDYRLAPEYPFPTAVEDSVAATRWVARDRARLGLSGDATMFIGGDSAGGNLATVTARLLRDDGDVRIAGQILAYPCTDNAQAASLRRFEPPFLNQAELEWFFRQYAPNAAQQTDPNFAPIYASDLAGLPPALLLTAEHDLLTEQAEEYGWRMREAGVPVEMLRFAGQFHGFVTVDAFFDDDGAEAMRAIIDFLERHSPVA